MTHPQPPFDPKVHLSSNVLVYEDGCVHADIEEYDRQGGGKSLQIFTWSSHTPGQGNTVRALRWLRERYTVISAHGVGMIDEIDGELVGDISTQYWQHMRSKGLVDHLLDDEGTEIDADNRPLQALAPSLR